MTAQLTRLDDLDEEAYADLVADNAHHGAPAELWAQLLAPGLCRRTRRVIGSLIQELNEETADRKRTMPEPQWHRWRRDVGLPNWQALNSRRHDADQASRKAHAAEVGKSHDASRTAVAVLASAIASHRAQCAIAGLEPEPHDADLWALLDSVRVPFGDREMTLAEALASGMWKPRAERQPS